MNKYKKLINNTVIFGIGNMGSKLMQFILIPIYSYSLTTNQFGQADIFLTFVNLLSPIICLGLIDGVFRFALDKNYDKRKVLSTGLIFSIISSLFTIFLFAIIGKIIANKYLILLSILISITIFYGLLSNFIRAIGYIKLYTIGGIINTFVMGITSILFLVVLRWEISGYLLANIIGQTIAIIFFFAFVPEARNINVAFFDKSIFKDMILYSMPLIPNNFAWWLNSASDRFFIVILLGTSANGIYSMINKFPTMINTIMNIFSQSWQLSAVEEFEKKDSKEFISSVFSYIISFTFFFSVGLLAVMKIVLTIMVDKNYYSGWGLIPILLESVVFMIISSFLGVLYTASKRTNGVLISTTFGAIINVILTIIFIRFFNIYGAAMANVVSFFCVAAYRFKFMYAKNKIEVPAFQLFVDQGIYLLATAAFYMLRKEYTFIICLVLSIVLIFIDANLKKTLRKGRYYIKYKLSKEKLKK